jgi:hypothetical protein
MPNCRLFHTIEKNIFTTVKNWWSVNWKIAAIVFASVIEIE